MANNNYHTPSAPGYGPAATYGASAAMVGAIFANNSTVYGGIVGGATGLGLMAGKESPALPRNALKGAARFFGGNWGDPLRTKWRKAGAIGLGASAFGVGYATGHPYLGAMIGAPMVASTLLPGEVRDVLANAVTQPLGRMIAGAGGSTGAYWSALGAGTGVAAGAALATGHTGLAGAGFGAILGARSGGFAGAGRGGFYGGIGGYLLGKTVKEQSAGAAGALLGFGIGALRSPVAAIGGAIIGGGFGTGLSTYYQGRADSPESQYLPAMVGGGLAAEAALIGIGSASYMVGRRMLGVGKGRPGPTMRAVAKLANLKNPLTTILGGAVLAGGLMTVAKEMHDSATRPYDRGFRRVSSNHLNSGGMSLAMHYKHNYGRAKT